MTRKCPHTRIGGWSCTTVVLALLLLPIASGCAATAMPAEPVTIRFAYGLEEPGFYEPLIAEFSATHPNVTIELVEANNDEADVYFVTPFELDGLVQEAAILNLDPFVQQDESFNRADFYPGTLEICSREGNLWAVPGGLTMQVLYYNDDLQDPTRATFDDPLTVEAMEWYAALIHEHNVMPTPRQMFDLGNSVQAGVYTNRVAMWSDWLAYQGGAGGLESPWPGEWKMRWGMVPLPRDAQAATLVIVFGYVISSQTASPEASWQWIAFLSKQVRSPYAMTPARKSLAESDAYAQLAGQAVAATARESMQGAILLSPTIAQYLWPYGQAIQAIRNGNVTPQEALTRAQRQAEQ